jgi:hypothetical protein
MTVSLVLPMIEWCRTNISTRFPRFRFKHADLKNTLYRESGGDAKDYTFPYPDRSFDVVLATSVFTHLRPASAPRYAKETAHVLNDDGRAFLSFYLRTEDYSDTDAELKFLYHYSDYHIAQKDNPEAVVALDERWVFSTLGGAGLSIDDVSYDSWNKHRGGGLQDVIVVSKAHSHGGVSRAQSPRGPSWALANKRYASARAAS